MWRRRKDQTTLDDVNEWLNGFGEMLQRIDARLEEIWAFLNAEDDDE